MQIDRTAADVERVLAIDAVPVILEAACKFTGMGFAAVARVTDTEWTACAVRDEIAFGLEPGGKLELSSTLCNEIREHRSPIVISDVAADPHYCNHHTPARYGLKSYISVPIVLADGSFFGTLCAIHPEPAPLDRPGVLDTFQLFARLVATELDTQARLTRNESALVDERAAAALRDQFIAVLGHDLRNPLASLQAGIHLLGRESLGEQPRNVLSLMAASERRMAALIDNILDFARGKLGGGLPVSIVPSVEVEALLEQVLSELRMIHPRRPIVTTVALRQPVAADPARLAQLMSNLVSNALTHGDPAHPVSVDLTSDGGRFTLSVANRGQPIPTELRRKLFEPFFRPELETPQEGLGLGLYIVAEIAKAHGGSIDVASDEQETRFVLTMPCQGPTPG